MGGQVARMGVNKKFIHDFVEIAQDN